MEDWSVMQILSLANVQGHKTTNPVQWTTPKGLAVTVCRSQNGRYYVLVGSVRAGFFQYSDGYYQWVSRSKHTGKNRIRKYRTKEQAAMAMAKDFSG